VSYDEVMSIPPERDRDSATRERFLIEAFRNNYGVSLRKTNLDSGPIRREMYDKRNISL
jgi:hypothetical protein